MSDFLQQIQCALQANLYYLSLFAALAIPDICGAMGSEGGTATPAKYKDWFDKYVGPKYSHPGCQFLTGADCYLFRCSMLHQGTSHHPNSRYSRFIFVEPSATRPTLHCNVMEDASHMKYAFNIDVRIFCEDMIAGATCWLGEVEGTDRFEKNYNRFMRRYPDGLRPFIVGFPVIS